MSSTPASWQPDPTGRHQHRYWDGTAWTEHVADAGVAATDPPTMDAPAAPSEAAPAPVAVPAFQAPVAPPGAQARGRKRAHAGLSFAAMAGGAALVTGSFLDSMHASIESIGFDASQGYLDGDGPLTLACGLVIIVLALLVGLGAMPHWGALIAAGFGGLGALIAVADIIDVQNRIDELDASGSLGTSASIGPALWVCLVGGIATLVLGLLAFVKARDGAPRT
jgi:hypothetical protein